MAAFLLTERMMRKRKTSPKFVYEPLQKCAEMIDEPKCIKLNEIPFAQRHRINAENKWENIFLQMEIHLLCRT